MSNIPFKGNPQHAVAAAGGVIAAIASAPAWAIGLGVAVVLGGAAYAIANKEKEKGEDK